MLAGCWLLVNAVERSFATLIGCEATQLRVSEPASLASGSLRELERTLPDAIGLLVAGQCG